MRAGPGIAVGYGDLSPEHPEGHVFSKVLIANRGEIAVRVMRTCRELGIATVAVYSDPDAEAPYVTLADQAVRLPGAAPVDTYLRGDLIIGDPRGRRRSPPDTASSPKTPTSRAPPSVWWIGPPPEAIEIAGDKISRKAAACRRRAVPGPSPHPGCRITGSAGVRGGGYRLPTAAAARV
jgi:propionyl-CoA carboxylase alpha chain